MQSPVSVNEQIIYNISKLKSPRVLLVGDFMLDEYIFGEASRISPEAPVPIVREKRREYRAGGAGNVALDIVALGGEVYCLGVLGMDSNGNLLRKLLEDKGIDTRGLLRDSERPTTSKTRIVSDGHQVLRVDKESIDPVCHNTEQFFVNHFLNHLYKFDLVCIEDYAKGVVTDRVATELIKVSREMDKEVIVDPSSSGAYSKYRGAKAIKPNRLEAEKSTSITISSDLSNLNSLALNLRETYDIETAIITLDKDGIYLSTSNVSSIHNLGEVSVHDVTGAGDMVLAALAVGRGSGLSWKDTVDFANAAGRLEVTKFGCVPLTKADIVADLHSQVEGKK